MYKVAEGASVCAKSKIYGPGDLVVPEIIGDGEEGCAKLVKAGVLVPLKDSKPDPSADIKAEVAAKAEAEKKKLEKKGKK